MSLLFIHGWLLNIDTALILIELLLVTDVNRKIYGKCIFIFNIKFFDSALNKLEITNYTR